MYDIVLHEIVNTRNGKVIYLHCKYSEKAKHVNIYLLEQY